MYREIAGTDERVRAIPGVRDRRVRVTKVRLYINLCPFLFCNQLDREEGADTQTYLLKRTISGVHALSGRIPSTLTSGYFLLSQSSW